MTDKPNDVRVSMAQVFKAVEYANDHPDRYLSGTTNWCAAVAFALNRQIIDAQPADQQGEPFQGRVEPWMTACFGAEISADRQERNHRFLEESLELVQACGATSDEAHQLVDYVYGRPTGEPDQEVGGVMVTLAALCLAHQLDMHAAGETELSRIWTKVDQIRAKQAAKPAMSPLPGAYPERHAQPATAKVDDQEEFEAWFLANVESDEGLTLERSAARPDQYELDETAQIYRGWQARAKLNGGHS
ncbi:hypothetical protein [Pseudomonas viridiflava]|uniref:hypothetical protein n=1 Tax=Pseudomonas viridiflava TaxID=33069 RepID=UPI002EB404CF|nr:hypothetical protein [Pseudomonas viridiflava]